MNTGEYALALNYSRKLAEVDPENLMSLQFQIQLLAQAGDLDAAREVQQEIDDRWPGHPFNNWLNLSWHWRREYSGFERIPAMVEFIQDSASLAD